MVKQTISITGKLFGGIDLESGFSNEVPFTVPGDGICPGEVNGDGVRNVLDVIVTMNHIVGNLTLEGDDLTAADVNEDGSVNVLDTHDGIGIVDVAILAGCAILGGWGGKRVGVPAARNVPSRMQAWLRLSRMIVVSLSAKAMIVPTIAWYPVVKINAFSKPYQAARRSSSWTWSIAVA